MLKILNIKPSEHRFITDFGNEYLFRVTSAGKEDGFEYKNYRLTPEGMKIAAQIIQHQDTIQQNKGQERLQAGMFLLTTILVLTSAMELIIKLLEPKEKWVLIVVVIMYLVVIYLLVYKSESLTYLTTKGGKKSMGIFILICLILLAFLAYYSTKIVPTAHNILPRGCLPFFLKCP